jgi:peptide/nickel transport system substrate-binding protein
MSVMIGLIRVGSRPRLLAILCIGVALACAGCGGSSNSGGGAFSLNAKASFYTGGTPGGTPVRGGTVVIDRSEAPSTLDPVESGLPGEILPVLSVFDQLTETFPGSDKEPQPGLAQSWTISPSGLLVTLHIRPGVKFSNGEPLTGEDVVYSLERLSLPTASAHFLTTFWSKVSLAGPMTVQIQLKKPTPSLLDDLSYVPTSIVPKKVVEREGQKQFALHPIGTGPFMIKSVTSSYSTIMMVANPHYWRAGQPYLERVIWNQVPEGNARVLAVRSGAATIATGIPFSQAGSLRSTPSARLLIEPLSGSAEEIVNNASSPLNEVNVRRALAYAIPRQQIIKSVYGGLGLPSNDVLGDDVKYWDPRVPTFPYDIAKAKELLKQSSVPHGFNMTITLPSGAPELALTAAIQQSAWAQIGVHVKIESLEPTSALNNFFTGKYQLYLYTPEDSVVETYAPDEVSLLDEDYPDSGNHSGDSYYNSPHVTELLRKAVTTTNEAEQGKLFGEIQYLVNFKEAGYFSVAFVPALTLVSPSLRGFEVPPTGYFRLEKAWLQK